MSAGRLEALGEHIASQQDAELEQAPRDDTAREQVALRVTERRSPGPRRSATSWASRRWLLASLALVLIGVLGVLRWARFAPAPTAALTFTVGGRIGALHALESAPSDRRLDLDFSDGTLISLAPRARARVGAANPAGAEVVLEAGEATMQVVPRTHGDADWRVRTGPFDVQVKGTRFDVAWDPSSEEFALRLFEGRVWVTGCGFGDGREVSAGYRVQASCRRPGFEIAPLELAVPIRPPASIEPTAPARVEDAPPANASAGEQQRRQRLPPSGGTRSKPSANWQELAREGRFDSAYELAKRAGFADVCARVEVDDVMLLGDAARHSGHLDSSRRAYETVRRRAPGSAAAAAAAFALGRLAMDGDPGKARRWFATSLRERPDGPLAQAARDRLFEVAIEQGAAAQAREAALKYLQGSPAGAHAERARALLGERGSAP